MAESSNLCKDLYKNENYTESFPSGEKACNLNNSDGCYHFGGLYHECKGVSQNLKQAKNYYEKPFNLDNNFGCYSLGLLYQYSQCIKDDFTITKHHYGKAFNLDYQYGCDTYIKLNKKRLLTNQF